MQTIIIAPENGEQRKIPYLIGGLSLIPLVLIIFADIIFNLWANWYPGDDTIRVSIYFACLFASGIVKFYENQYSFKFAADPDQKKGSNRFFKLSLAVVGLCVIVCVPLLLDIGRILPVRLMPLIAGVLMLLQGIDWFRKNWRNFGLVNGGMGIGSILFSFLPWIGGSNFQNLDYGVDVLLEIAILGCMVIIISVLEHVIVLKIVDFRNSDEKRNLPIHREDESQIEVSETEKRERRVIPVMVGGLALLPYVFFVSLGGDLQNTLHPSDDDGTGIQLGLMFALLAGIFVIKFYRKKGFYQFLMDPEGPVYSYKTRFLLMFLCILLVLLYLFDHSQVFFVRLTPFVTGLIMILRGCDWFRKNWKKFGLIHGGLGVISVGISVLPWYGSPVEPVQFIGIDLAIEYALLGFAVVVISIMEHLIVRQVHAYQVSLEIAKTGSQISSQQAT